MLMQLHGDPSQWFDSEPESAPKTSAYIRCVTQQDQMKRQMYVFLKEALIAKLRADGLMS